MKVKNNFWFMYAVAAGLLWGIWGVVAKLISEEVNPFMNHLLFTIGMLGTLPLILKKCTRTSFNLRGIVWGCIAGCFAIAGNVAVYYAFKNGGAGIHSNSGNQSIPAHYHFYCSYCI